MSKLPTATARLWAQRESTNILHMCPNEPPPRQILANNTWLNYDLSSEHCASLSATTAAVSIIGTNPVVGNPPPYYYVSQLPFHDFRFRTFRLISFRFINFRLRTKAGGTRGCRLPLARESGGKPKVSAGEAGAGAERYSRIKVIEEETF